MEYEHLFAESDIEESEVAPIESYNDTPHANSQNSFMFGGYIASSNTNGNSNEYWQTDTLNCDMWQNRQAFKKESGTRQLSNIKEDRTGDTYRHKRMLHDQDGSVKHKKKDNDEQKRRIDQQVDNFNIAGPSRMSDYYNSNR